MRALQEDIHTRTHSAHTILQPYVTMLHSSAFLFFVFFLFFLAFAVIKFRIQTVLHIKWKRNKKMNTQYFFFYELLNVLLGAWYSSIQYSSTQSNYYLNRQWNAHPFIPHSSASESVRNLPFWTLPFTGNIQLASSSLTSWFPPIVVRTDTS